MKILYISDAGSIHTQRWAHYFSSQGCDVEVASFREGNNINVPVHILQTYGFGKLGYLFAVVQLKRIVEIFKPDIIHAQYITSYGFLASRAKLHPLILTAWGSDILVSPKESLIARCLVRYALNRADAITTVAEHMNKYIYEYCHLCKDVKSIPFGVDLKIFSFVQNKENSRKKLKLISTRNFAKLYSIDTLIKATAILDKKGIEVELDLIGDGILRKNLDHLVDKLDLREKIIFHGHIEQVKMVRLLQDADIFISTAISDGNNISLNEAMACGCFPIATDIPANSQWISDSKNGFLFEVKNSIELANAIEKFTIMDSIEGIILENRKLVENKANWKLCVNEMYEKYLELMK